jgi:predicted NBD/HSP70 family sugar kinase
MQNIATSVQLKERNMARVMTIIRTRGPISRINVAKELDLSPPTVSSVVEELLADRLVEEVGVGLSGGGRKPVLLALKPDAAYALGADFSDQSVKVAVVDLAGRVAEKREKHFGKSAAWSEMVAALGDFSQELGERYPVAGLGVAAPGIVSPEGMLHYASLQDWHNLPLREDCEAVFSGIVAVENNVRAMALGEYWFGAGEQLQNLIMVRIGGGVGSGIVLDGQIFRGDLGAAGEIGHMTVEPGGPKCSCGNLGCLEAVAAVPVLLEKFGGSETDLAAALARADQRAGAIVEEAGEALGIALANLINLLSPRLIVLSCPLEELLTSLLPIVRRVVQRRSISWQRGRVAIVASDHGQNASVVGAATLILSRLLSQPRTFFLKTATNAYTGTRAPKNPSEAEKPGGSRGNGGTHGGSVTEGNDNPANGIEGEVLYDASAPNEENMI